MKDYRTDEDIWKDIARIYTQLGKALDELNRAYKEVKNDRSNKNT